MASAAYRPHTVFITKLEPEPRVCIPTAGMLLTDDSLKRRWVVVYRVEDDYWMLVDVDRGHVDASVRFDVFVEYLNSLGLREVAE